MRILEVLWAENEATAKRLTEVLSAEEPISLSTVQTLLRKLEAKGSVTRDASERIHRFRPNVPRDQVVRSATQDLLDKTFRGSVAGLLAHLFDERSISVEVMTEIRRVIDAYEREATR